jgi:hypothetical protein
MASIGNYIYNTLSAAMFGANAGDSTKQDGKTLPEKYSSDRYQPSVSDVITVKEALHKKSTLPYELVDAVIDFAEYWPHTSTITQQPTIVQTGRNQEHERFIVSRSNVSSNGGCPDLHPQSQVLC